MTAPSAKPRASSGAVIGDHAVLEVTSQTSPPPAICGVPPGPLSRRRSRKTPVSVSLLGSLEKPPARMSSESGDQAEACKGRAPRRALRRRDAVRVEDGVDLAERAQ